MLPRIDSIDIRTPGLASLKFRSILVKSSSALALIGPDAAAAEAFSLTLARSLSTKEKGCGSVQLDAVEAMDGVGEGPLAAGLGGRFGDLPLCLGLCSDRQSISGAKHG